MHYGPIIGFNFIGWDIYTMEAFCIDIELFKRGA